MDEKIVLKFKISFCFIFKRKIKYKKSDDTILALPYNKDIIITRMRLIFIIYLYFEPLNFLMLNAAMIATIKIFLDENITKYQKGKFTSPEEKPAISITRRVPNAM